MIALVLVALLQSGQLRPDTELTPGKVRPLTQDVVCATKWGTDRRFVTAAMRRHVFRAYGIAWERRAEFEVDHLVPRSLAGADDILNLWPESFAGDMGARKKDRLEIRLSVLVCSGKVGLSEAQRAIRSDWLAAYARYVQGPNDD